VIQPWPEQLPAGVPDGAAQRPDLEDVSASRARLREHARGLALTQPQTIVDLATRHRRRLK